MKTRNDYLSSLTAMKPNMYKFGEQITNVVTHPATKRTVESHARAFDAANNPELEELFTTTSYLSGKKIMRFNSLMKSPEDLLNNAKLKRDVPHDRYMCRWSMCWLERYERNVGSYPRNRC